MILDEFGRPIVARTDGFITPDWVNRAMGDVLRTDVERSKAFVDDMKISELYESAGIEREHGTMVGSTVSVRLPKRMERA